MIRAMAFFAMITVVGAASAQNGAPLKNAPEATEPTIALADGKATSACGKQECPVPNAETTSDKPLDNHAVGFLHIRRVGTNARSKDCDSATGLDQCSR